MEPCAKKITRKNNPILVAAVFRLMFETLWIPLYDRRKCNALVVDFELCARSAVIRLAATDLAAASGVELDEMRYAVECLLRSIERLDAALHSASGETLRERIVAQYPVALIDEFQDTSPLQYRIFDQLYRTPENDPAHALLLIGDPKQSIYAFRGADIHSYLAARRATAGRHYALGTNFRSTGALVGAVNQIFELASAYPAGAFRFRNGADDPLPFVGVNAAGRKEKFVTARGPAPAASSGKGVQRTAHVHGFVGRQTG